MFQNGGAGRTALVLGATGGVGGETASALLRHGWRVRALARDPAAAASKARIAHKDIEWIGGDATDRAGVASAAAGAALLVHAVNPPGYKNWEALVMPMIENTIAAARVSGARIALPGTIYNYGRDAFPVLREASPQNPMNSKGRIRVALEKRLEDEAKHGVRSLIVRAGDFFGPHPGNNWFSQGLVTPGKPLRAVTYPGKAGVGHAWAYLPDLGETFAQLADREVELDDFARFHFAGHWDPDGTHLPKAIGRAIGNPGIKVKALPWGILALVAPFSETVRGLREVAPLWHDPIQLDNAKLTAFLGEEPRTPLDDAIRTTLQALKVTAA